MAGEVTKRAPGSAPTLQSPEMHRLCAVLRNKIEVNGTKADGADRCSISSQFAPTSGQLATLKARRGDLADALTPRAADRATAADAILEMFYCWPDTRRMEAGKAAATAAKYLETLDGLPLWAIDQACRKMAKLDTAWPPSAGELRAAALHACKDAREELGDLQRIISAQVYEAGTVEERARVNDGFDALIKDIAGGLDRFREAARPRSPLPSRFDDAKMPRVADGPLPPLSQDARCAAGYAPAQEAAE